MCHLVQRARLTALIVTIAACCPLSTGAQPIYLVTDLGTLGGANSSATHVNDNGQVVGWSETDELGASGVPRKQAFSWSAGSMVGLGTLGGTESSARSANNAGAVVGWAKTINELTRAFIWLPEPAFGMAAGMNDLGTLDCPQTAAHDINESAQVVGTWGGGVFIWLPTPAYGLPAGLNAISPDSWSGHCSTYCFDCNPFGMNDRGEVVSQNQVWLPSAAYGHPRGWSNVWFFAFDYYHYATDITNQGLVMANFYPLGGAYIVARFVQDDKESDMYVGTWSGGANDLGEIVASYYAYPLPPQPMRYIVSGNGLSPGVDPNSRRVPETPWLLAAAYDVNNRGQIVGSSAPNVHGEYHALLFSPIDTDLDGNGETDLSEYSRFPGCLTGPGAAVECPRRDYDNDMDVDLRDFRLFQWAFGSQP